MRALTTDRNKDAAPGPGRVRGGYGEVGAAHDAELDTSIDEERETDDALLATQEALRAVDGITCLVHK